MRELNKLIILFLLMTYSSLQVIIASEDVQVGPYVERDQDLLTSAAVTVTSEELNFDRSINAANLLTGMLNGLTVMQKGGFGAQQAPNLFVRGRSTFGPSAPLVLVDGFERPISLLNSADIASVTVLKDAASTAIYGQRGANGVILVTTKRAETEGLRIDVSAHVGISSPFALPEMLDSEGYANAYNEALILDGKNPLYTNSDILAYRSGQYPDYYPNVDWFGEALNTLGHMEDFNLNFTGGSSRVKYYINAAFHNQESFLSAELSEGANKLAYNRATVRSNLDVDITNSTKMKLSIFGNIATTRGPRGGSNNDRYSAAGIFQSLYKTPSNAFAIRNSAGKWGINSLFSTSSGNPLAQINALGTSKMNDQAFMGDLSLTQDLSVLTEGFSISAGVSYNYFNSYFDTKSKNVAYVESWANYDEYNNELFNRVHTTFGEDLASSYSSQTSSRWSHANLHANMKYERSFGKHHVDALLFYHLDSKDINNQHEVYRRQNIALNARYNYDHRYILDLTASYAGSSVLPSENRYILYPAASAAWLISNERFWDAVKDKLSLFKLRASFGISGNDYRSNMSTQAYLGDLYFSNLNYGYSFGEGNVNAPTIVEGYSPNPDITTEKSGMLNIGLDLEMFDHLMFQADVFKERRYDILVSTNGRNSDITGEVHSMNNAGIVDNQGFEVGLRWSDIDENKDFGYWIGASVSYSRNKIIQKNEQYRETQNIRQTGKPIDQMLGLVSDGFFNTQEEIDAYLAAGNRVSFSKTLKPGDVRYVDIHEDGVINSNDRVSMDFYNSVCPEWYGSLDLGLQYKGFYLTALLQGVANYSVNLMSVSSVFLPFVNNTSISEYSNNRWTPQNAHNATLPRLTVESNLNNHQLSDIWIADASFLKLRNVEIGYQFDEKVLGKSCVSKLSLYLRGDNLLSIDGIEYFDPEVISMGYPSDRSFHFGLVVGF